MPTYRHVQEYVRARHGYTVKTCWIAHVKEMEGLAPRRAPNRQSSRRTNPCPPDKVDAIREALKATTE
jgi:hypothetical protein